MSQKKPWFEREIALLPGSPLPQELLDMINELLNAYLSLKKENSKLRTKLSYAEENRDLEAEKRRDEDDWGDGVYY